MDGVGGGQPEGRDCGAMEAPQNGGEGSLTSAVYTDVNLKRPRDYWDYETDFLPSRTRSKSLRGGLTTTATTGVGADKIRAEVARQPPSSLLATANTFHGTAIALESSSSSRDSRGNCTPGM